MLQSYFFLPTLYLLLIPTVKLEKTTNLTYHPSNFLCLVEYHVSDVEEFSNKLEALAGLKKMSFDKDNELLKLLDTTSPGHITKVSVHFVILSGTKIPEKLKDITDEKLKSITKLNLTRETWEVNLEEVRSIITSSIEEIKGTKIFSSLSDLDHIMKNYLYKFLRLKVTNLISNEIKLVRVSQKELKPTLKLPTRFKLPSSDSNFKVSKTKLPFLETDKEYLAFIVDGFFEDKDQQLVLAGKIYKDDGLGDFIVGAVSKEKKILLSKSETPKIQFGIEEIISEDHLWSKIPAGLRELKKQSTEKEGVVFVQIDKRSGERMFERYNKLFGERKWFMQSWFVIPVGGLVMVLIMIVFLVLKV